MNDGERERLATLRGRLRHEHATDPGGLPVTGDWVLVHPGDGDDTAVVEQVLPRRTAMSRKVAGARTDEQVVAANVDLVAVCSPADDVNLRRLERELTLVWQSGALPAVVVTKSDLTASPDEIRIEVASVALGVPVVLVSSYDSTGIGELAALLAPGRTVAVVGPSGAGKSTLGNALLGADSLATQATVRPGASSAANSPMPVLSYDDTSTTGTPSATEATSILISSGDAVRSDLVTTTAGSAPDSQTRVSSRSSRRRFTSSAGEHTATRSTLAATTCSSVRPPAPLRLIAVRRGRTCSTTAVPSPSPGCTSTQSPVTGSPPGSVACSCRRRPRSVASRSPSPSFTRHVHRASPPGAR